MEIKTILKITQNLKPAWEEIFLDKKIRGKYNSKKFIIFTLFFIILIIYIIFQYLLKKVIDEVKSNKHFYINKESLIIKEIPYPLNLFINNITPFIKNKINIFDKDLFLKIKKGYLKNPYVKEVVYIKKCYPNKIYVKLKIFYPLFFLKLKKKYILISSDITKLPATYNSPIGDLPKVEIEEISYKLDNLNNNVIQKLSCLYLVKDIILNLNNNNFKEILKNIKKFYIKDNIIYIIFKDKKIVEWGKNNNSLFPPLNIKKKIYLLKEINLIHNIESFYSTKKRKKKSIVFDIKFGYIILKTKKLYFLNKKNY